MTNYTLSAECGAFRLSGHPAKLGFTSLPHRSWDAASGIWRMALIAVVSLRLLTFAGYDLASDGLLLFWLAQTMRQSITRVIKKHTYWS